MSAPNARIFPMMQRARSASHVRPRLIEVAEPGRESVWDFPRPPRVEPVVPRVRIVAFGETIVDTQCALRVVETAGAPCYYISPHDVAPGVMREARGSSLCEWKGHAAYYDVVVGDRTSADAAWCYPDPWTDLGAGYERIAGWFAFYVSRVDACYLDDERVRPQPGGFYGGWVTGALAGPIKGQPGSDAW